jgi:hypothetical protein
MKNKTRVWTALLVAVGAVCVFAVLLLSGVGGTVLDGIRGGLVSAQERAEIQETIAGAYEAMAKLGAFPSEDGTTANLSDEELDEMIRQYNEIVQGSYATEATQYTAYPEMNQEYLREIFRAPEEIYNRLDGGVTQCDINKIRMDKTGKKATVDASVIKWSVAVYQWKEASVSGEPYYSVTPSIGKNHVVVQVVREDGTWRVSETEEYTLLESGYNRVLRDRVLGKYDLDKSLTTTEDGVICKISDSEADTILAALEESGNESLAKTAASLQQNLAAYRTKYPTVAQAIQAAKGLDVPRGNYFALAEELKQVDGAAIRAILFQN